jgi:NAD(P)-dependent dehydrogenase (short-subunit alcohol dehydrogenase family)
MQHVLVTGAARGLGRALISELVDHGRIVIALVRSQSDAHALTDQFREKVAPLCCDLTSPQLEEQVETFFRRSGIGALDCLVNNAGLSSHVAPLAGIDVSEVGRLLDVNLLGPIRMTKACLPQLLKSEAPLVLNISSRLGSLAGTARKDAPDGSYAYRISKAALNMFTLCMAIDPSLRGVKVISMHPGSIRTAMGGAAAAESAEAAAKKVVAVIDNISSVESGAFLNAEGGRLEW